MQPDETRILYVSPLKALGNDIHKNLEEPLTGIREELRARGLPDVAIRTAVLMNGTAHIQVGAGIVADSVPEREYEETMNKAAGMLRAVKAAEAIPTS